MPDDFPDVYVLETIEQMRALSDALRLRIVHLLARQQMTVTQVGAELGIAVGKAHYHVRELERVGLVRLVETREKGGVLEKYYRAVARDFSVPPTLLRELPVDEQITTTSTALEAATREFLAAMATALRSGDPELGIMNYSEGRILVTKDEFYALIRQVVDMLRPYSAPRPAVPEAVERAIIFAAYTVSPAAVTPTPGQKNEEPTE